MLVLFDITSVALLFGLIFTPLVRDTARRLRLLDRPDGARKLHGGPIPRLGGVAVVLAYICALGFVAVAPYGNVEFDVSKVLLKVLALLPAVGVVFVTGLVDDIGGLKPWQKVTGQFIGALLAYAAGFGVHVFQGRPLEVWISLPVTVLWLILCSNAVNLVDGMDGLAAGVGFFACITTLLVALTRGNWEMALLTAPLAGSLLGFLRYNFNPASIFLGDSGSLVIGFLLGCFGGMWSHKSATLLGMTAPLIPLSFPLLEVSLSVVRRLVRNRSVFSSDRGHIHHRLLERGLTPTGAAVLLYGVCGLAAAFSLVMELAHNQIGGLIIVLFCASAWIGIQHLGYAELGVAGRLMFSGNLRGIIDVQIRIQEFERALRDAATLGDAWDMIREGCPQFGFSAVRLHAQNDGLRDLSAAEVSASSWQLRISLPDGQYLSLYRGADSNMHPMILASFGEAVERVLTARLLEFKAKEQSPAASSSHGPPEISSAAPPESVAKNSNAQKA